MTKAKIYQSQFEAKERERPICVCAGESLDVLVRNTFGKDRGDISVFLNEKRVDESTWRFIVLRENDVVDMVPLAGEPVSAFIAAMANAAAFAVDVAAMGIHALGPSWATSYAIVNMGIMFGTGMALSYLMTPSSPTDRGYASEESRGHSWQPQTTQQPGIPRPELFGRILVHGNITGCHREWATGTDLKHAYLKGDRTYAITGITQANPAVVTAPAHDILNDELVRIRCLEDGMTELNDRIFKAAGTAGSTLQLVGVNSTGYSAYVRGGIIEKVPYITQRLFPTIGFGGGPIQSISNVRLQQRPVENLASIGIEKRLGITNQESLKKYQKIVVPRLVNQMASQSNPTILHKTLNNYMDGMIVTLYFPYGIHDPAGGMHSINITLKYREYPNGSWVTIFDNSFRDNRLDPSGIDFYVKGLVRGRYYQVSLKKNSADKASTYGDEVWLESVKEVLNVAAKAPQHSGVGIDALATDQISGRLEFDCIVEGNICQVYKGVSDEIEDISQASQAVVEIADNDYVEGDYMLIMGILSGMTEMNYKFGRVVSVSGDYVTIDIDSSDFSTYVDGGTAYKMSLEYTYLPPWVYLHIMTRPLLTGGDGGDYNTDDLADADLQVFCKMEDNTSNSVITCEKGNNGTMMTVGAGATYTSYYSATGYRDLGIYIERADACYINWSNSVWDVSDELTFGVYIKPLSTLCNPIFDCRFQMAGVGDDHGWFFGTDDAGRLVFASGNGEDSNAEDNVCVSYLPIILNQWQWVVVVKSGQVVDFYIDGVYIGGGTLATGDIGYDAGITHRHLGMCGGDSWINSGLHGFGSRTYADMVVDDLKFWNRALTWEEISQKFGRNPFQLHSYRGVKPDKIDLDKLYEWSEKCSEWVCSLAYSDITNISNANPGVVTSPAHGRATGDKIIILESGGMTQVNEKVYTVTVIDNDSFSIGVDTTGFDSYTSGGKAYKAEHRFEFHDAIEADTNPWAAALKTCEIGRAGMIQGGNRYSVTLNVPKEPQQLFSVANFRKGSIRGRYMGFKDRIGEYEANFRDAEQDYNRCVIGHYDKAINNPNNKSTINFFGSTSERQTRSEIDYRVRRNKYVKRAFSGEVYVDALRSVVGDCVWCQCNRPRWNKLGKDVSGSGRVISGTTTTVVIDTDITDGIDGGTTYGIMFRLQDTDVIVTREITDIDGREITFTPALDPGEGEVLKAGDIWVVGEENIVAKKFEIVQIDLNDDDTRKVGFVEYIDEVNQEEPAYEEA